MKLHTDILQGSEAWLELRRGKITGTDVSASCLEPRKITLTVAELKKELDAYGLTYTSKHLRPDLIALLPDPAKYEELDPAVHSLLVEKIDDSKPRDPWRIMQDEKEAAQMARMIAIQRGNALEPFARQLYGRMSGNIVREAAFIESDCGTYGFSPDGLIFKGDEMDLSQLRKILECKSPFRKTHLRWLLAWIDKREFPKDHYWQCQHGLAVTGCQSLDFFSFCPSEPALLITMERDETTDKLRAGLDRMAIERRTIEGRISEIWKGQFEGRQDLLTYRNGAPVFDEDGTMLDEDGNRSIFDDVDADDETETPAIATA